MDWFRNKKDTKQPQEPAAPVISQPDIQTEDVSSRSQCLAQLNKLFAPVPSKGMAVKIYLENFKSLNQAFGYEYCEKLLSQITAYLKDISEVTVILVWNLSLFWMAAQKDRHLLWLTRS